MIGKDGKDGGVVGGGCCGEWGVVVWVWPAPLGRPVALTLALSRLAGEGTVCGVLCFSLDSRVRGNDVGLAGRDGCCGIGGVVVMKGVGVWVVGAVREPPLRVG